MENVAFEDFQLWKLMLENNNNNNNKLWKEEMY